LSDVIELKVPADASGKRLDVFLASEPKLHGGKTYLSRSRIQHLIEAGAILIDGEKAEKSMRLRGGEFVRVVIPDPESPDDIPPEDLPVDVVFEDDDIVVVNKPAGISTHPTAEMPTGTVVNALKGLGIALPKMYYPYRPGIVHRLDKNTSGLLVVAKREEPYLRLVEMMKDRSINRLYRALTVGNLPELEGRFEGDIGRHPGDRKKMAVVVKGGKNAHTLYNVLERYPGMDYVQVKLLTGRTHQIRVHFSHAGTAVLGDLTYGGKATRKTILPAIDRIGVTPLDRARWISAVDKLEKIKKSATGHMLHAYSLSFKHPLKDEELKFELNLPDYFNKALSILRKFDEVPREP